MPNRQHSKPEILALERGRKNILLEFDLWRAAEISLVLEYCLWKGAEILKQFNRYFLRPYQVLFF